MILKGLARRGAGAFTMAWGPLARLLLAWTALLCLVGVQGRWDKALESAGSGHMRRRGGPGILQGCVVPGMLRGCGLGWVAPLCWGEQGPGNIPQGGGSPAVPRFPEGPMCAAPVSMPTVALAGGHCQAGTSVLFVSATAIWRGLRAWAGTLGQLSDLLASRTPSGLPSGLGQGRQAEPWDWPLPVLRLPGHLPCSCPLPNYLPVSLPACLRSPSLSLSHLYLYLSVSLYLPPRDSRI